MCIDIAKIKEIVLGAGKLFLDVSAAHDITVKGDADFVTAVDYASEKYVKAELEKTNNVEAAAAVGKVIAQKALEKGIKTVVFDRGGFIYQGKIKALADAARETGLEF